MSKSKKVYWSPTITSFKKKRFESPFVDGVYWEKNTVVTVKNINVPKIEEVAHHEEE